MNPESGSKARHPAPFLTAFRFLGIRKNHVVLAQSTSLKAPQFEEYLNWVLREAGVMKDNDYVSLNDMPPLGREKDVVKTKGIEIHAPVRFDPVAKREKEGCGREGQHRG